MAKIVDFNLVECDEILFESTSLQSYGYGVISQLPMKDRDLAIQAKAIYAYLVSCAGNDKQTYPTQKKICYDLKISNTDILAKYIKQLQASGYIKIVKTKNGNLYYRNVYLIATDTRSIEIWKQEFAEGKEIEEAEIITESKKSLTYGEVKDNQKSKKSNIDNSIPQNEENETQNLENEKINIQEVENEANTESEKTTTDNKIDFEKLAYEKCLNEIEGFEQMDSMRKDFFLGTMLRKISLGGN